MSGLLLVYVGTAGGGQVKAIEPLIGHTKANHRMDRCWLQGAVGDALHALSCAAGYNIRWLMRAIARLGLGGFFYACFHAVVYGLGWLRWLLTGSVAPKRGGSARCEARLERSLLGLAASG